ncbi:DsbA family protein [Pantoea anthophila]|uniref:DsbA family protein n=1 Tax=Pantoea anthophila TaxID=470931 RepID=UPI002DB66241|nr:thioredoxin domain-containing protein [Pantoea anthophila]MEB7538340.1 DsbA family protein [Pantoea anthophila]
MNQHADVLVWGQGPAVFEVFLEPTCPFSVRAFNKFDALLALAGEENITLKIRLQSQPWHLYSGLIVRYILAAACESKTAARQVMQAVADHREEFEFTDHCAGPNRDATPNQILERLKTYSGVDAMAAFDRPDLQNAIKWHCKYARQNGIHVSPTFMVNGLVQPEISSGDDIEQWASFLKR